MTSGKEMERVYSFNIEAHKSINNSWLHYQQSHALILQQTSTLYKFVLTYLLTYSTASAESMNY